MRRTMTPAWVTIAATLAFTGLLLLADGGRLSLQEVTLAAPVPRNAAFTAGRAGRGAAAGSAENQPRTGVAGLQAGDPEFGGRSAPGPQPNQQGADAAPVIHSTTPQELVVLARKNSGREDPFVALTMPQAAIVVPLPPPEPKVVAVPPPPGMSRKRIGNQWVLVPTVVQPTFSDPRWNVEGILNTGRDQMVILEEDGKTVEARIGDILDDGSRVVSITSQQVTLMAHGQRYIKQIGGPVPQ